MNDRTYHHRHWQRTTENTLWLFESGILKRKQYTSGTMYPNGNNKGKIRTTK